MKINWNQNPLLTTVDVDERDRNIILTYLQSEALIDLFCEIEYHINKDAIDFEYTKKTIKEWGPIADMEPMDEKVEYMIEALQGIHIGDCTCMPASCLKCWAEASLHIDTTKGLGKHEGSAIFAAFDKYKNIDEVIEYLGKPHDRIKPEAWKTYTQEQYEVHIPRWEAERKRALEWLIAYKAEHGFGAHTIKMVKMIPEDGAITTQKIGTLSDDRNT